MSVEQIFGVYKGIVKNNRDPQERRRVSLYVPQLLGGATSAWAEPSDIGGSLPAIGDGAWVQFNGGDITKPMYISTALKQPITISGQKEITTDVVGTASVSYGMTFAAPPNPVICMASVSTSIPTVVTTTVSGFTLHFFNSTNGVEISLGGPYLINWIATGTPP